MTLEPEVDAWLEDREEAHGDEWRITFSDGTPETRTTIAGIAWYADNHDDDATVETL